MNLTKVKFRVMALYDHDVVFPIYIQLIELIVFITLQAEEDDELSFKINDMIEILDDSDPGWWFGKHQSSGKSGLLPMNYVQRL